jgi:hypothetical protein
LILSRSDGAYSDDLARRLLRPLLEQQNHDNISRVIDLMPAALASTPQYRDELLESIFKAKWSSSLLLPIASGLVDLQDMLQSSSSSSSLSSSHWASLRVKLLNHLARKDFEAADYAGVIRLLLRLLVRLDQEEWFDVVRKTLHHVPVMSWRNVSYIISITCQQSNRLSRLIVEGLGRLAEGEEENSVMTYTDLILMLAAAKGLDDVLIVTSALERNAYAEDDVNKLSGTRVHEVVRRVLIRCCANNITVKDVVQKVCRCADGACALLLMNAAKFWCEKSDDVSSNLVTDVLSHMFQIFPGCRYEILRTIFDAFDDAATTSALVQQEYVPKGCSRGFKWKHVENSHFNIIQYQSWKLLSNLCENVETARHLGTCIRKSFVRESIIPNTIEHQQVQLRSCHVSVSGVLICICTAQTLHFLSPGHYFQW